MLLFSIIAYEDGMFVTFVNVFNTRFSYQRKNISVGAENIS
jgi:hypothetical protein